MKKSGRLLGGIIIALGILFLMKNLGIFEPVWGVINPGALLGRFWPSLFLLLPGLLFHYSFFTGTRKDPGLLVPGGILLVLGLVFQFNMLFGGWDITWPLIIFSVAFGLFELYIFGNREKGLLIPIGILGGLSFLFFFSFSLSRLLNFNTRPYAIPVLLIGVGLILVSGGRKSRV
ncbi:MAG TPA: hypothetical protein PLP87_06430 [Clostridiales bacterium]|nr:hypothetical protein [Clostridiales bacterium]